MRDTLVTPPRDEGFTIWDWRLTMFTQLGYTHDEADLLARTTIDYHELANLIDQGCPRELALEIVA